MSNKTIIIIPLGKDRNRWCKKIFANIGINKWQLDIFQRQRKKKYFAVEILAPSSHQPSTE